MRYKSYVIGNYRFVIFKVLETGKTLKYGLIMKYPSGNMNLGEFNNPRDAKRMSQAYSKYLNRKDMKCLRFSIEY